MSDLSLPPVEGLVKLINAKISSAPTTVDDYSVIFPPVAIDPLPDGSNTQVTVKTSMDYTHAGRATFFYTRVDLGTLFTPAISANVDDVDTFADYLTALTSRYGLYFSEDDLEPVQPFDVSGGELSYVVAIRAKPTSYAYVGTGNVTVRVTWRLDDPELVEQEVDRLRQLVNFTLPLSISLLL